MNKNIVVDENLVCAETLVAQLKAAKHFGETKAAVMRFITSMDGHTANGTMCLGDGDLCALAAEYLERRGKTPRLGLMLMESHLRTVAKAVTA